MGLMMVGGRGLSSVHQDSNPPPPRVVDAAAQRADKAVCPDVCGDGGERRGGGEFQGRADAGGA